MVESDANTDRPLAVQNEVELTRAFWDPEGDIVLQAGKSQYLVESLRLRSVSRVFKDMLSHSTVSTHELVDGRYPLVVVHDSAEDWVHFIRAVYDPLKYLFGTFFSRESCPLLCGVLRLSNKYEAISIRSAAASHLEEKYRRLASFAIMPGIVDGSALYAAATSILFGEWDYIVANVLEEAHLLSSLPAALYICAVSKDPEQIFNSTLSATNKQRVLHSLHLLQAAYLEQVLVVASLCESSDTQCSCTHNGKLQLSTDASRGWLRPFLGVDAHPLMMWHDIPATRRSALCLHQNAYCQDIWDEAVKALVHKLPGMFGLPGWKWLFTQDLHYKETMANDSPDNNVKESETSPGTSLRTRARFQRI